MSWPSLTRYTDGLPTGVNGEARGPIILIRSAYRDDAGLHAHEHEHVRQWWTVGLLTAVVIAIVAALVDARLYSLIPLAAAAHPAAYRLIRRYRLGAEYRAYHIQMANQDRNGNYLQPGVAAYLLASPRYRLGLDYQAALAIIRNGL